MRVSTSVLVLWKRKDLGRPAENPPSQTLNWTLFFVLFPVGPPSACLCLAGCIFIERLSEHRPICKAYVTSFSK